MSSPAREASARRDSPSHSTGRRPNTGSTIPQYEHDSCGVGFVANIKGVRSRADHRRRRSHSAAPDPSRRHRLRSQYRRRGRNADGSCRTNSSGKLAAADLGVELPRAGLLRRRQCFPADRRPRTTGVQGDGQPPARRAGSKAAGLAATCRRAATAPISDRRLGPPSRRWSSSTSAPRPGSRPRGVRSPAFRDPQAGQPNSANERSEAGADVLHLHASPRRSSSTKGC